ARSHGPGDLGHVEQAGRLGSRGQRDHREGPSRSGDAEDAGRVARRTGQDGGEAQDAARQVASLARAAERITGVIPMDDGGSAPRLLWSRSHHRRAAMTIKSKLVPFVAAGVLLSSVAARAQTATNPDT